MQWSAAGSQVFRSFSQLSQFSPCTPFLGMTSSSAMDLRKRIDKEIEKQEAHIDDLRHQLTAAEAYLKAQQDMLKMLPRETDPARNSAASLRPGSDSAKIRDILQEAGTPIHLDQILAKMGRPPTRENKSAISGTLSGYVRRGVIFTRPAPNTFGLRPTAEEPAMEEPPESFGTDEPG